MVVCEHNWIDEDTGCKACKYQRCTVCGALKRTHGCDIHSFRESHYNHQDYYKDILQGGIVRADRYAQELYGAMLCVDWSFEGDSVLEIGAGLGMYIPFWNSYGKPYTAIEMSEFGARFIEQVYCGSVINRPIDVAWDMFFCWIPGIIFSAHWLEHMQDADLWFAKMCDRAKNQVVCIVPVGTDLHNRDHWWYFNEAVLEKWSRACGYEPKVVRKSYSPHEDFLFLFARRAE